ncbi:outer membrane lipoprotein carrier protein LolA [Halomonas sp. M4R1S46]|uniref:outer membrane lipoprotein carrier protein LolA n=1 Tax=Halomonas sp. M4R1S46 TaxID=2982692 RepID=UPI0021E4892D|nr:outer membrane lipoprotein carrier protein LolA [Halomonas sp. M4R1S46]UYG06901.1 outer membrane lipoprotein carrier protein LolA [Halomonas sp. M4R1S46]
MTRLLALLLCLLPATALAFGLEDLQRRLEATPGLEGRFVQTRYLADLDSQLESTGHFRYERDVRVVWTLETPVEERLEFSAASPPEVGADDRRQAQAAALFLDLLQGHWPALEERFTLTLSGDADAWRVTLRPRQAALRQRIDEIRLHGGRYLERLALDAANGDRLRVRLFDQRAAEAGDAAP